VALQRGRLTVAAECFRNGYRIIAQSAMRTWEGFSLVELALVAERLNDWERSARLFGASAASWDRLGICETARSFATWGPRRTPTDAMRNDERYAAAFAAGSSLSPGQIFTEAMAVGATARADSSEAWPLTSRELEVLILIAKGHTNREIAEALFISKRTVDSHVNSILSRLGADSRRSAVALARERGLLTSSS
jgi:non-specific serine/threonine protein kinase